MPRKPPASQHLSNEERWDIIHEWKGCKNLSKVARTLSSTWKRRVSIKRVKYWVDVYKKHSSVVVRKPSGRPKVVSAAAARVAAKLLVDKEQFGTSQAVASELHKRGLTMGPKPVHKTTLIRAAKAQAKEDNDELEVFSGKPGKALREATIKQRLEFAKKHMGRNWANVMFTDRCKFAFRYPGTKVKHKVWVSKSQGGKASIKCWQPNNPQRLNLYMGITKFGVTKIHKVTGSHGTKSTYKTKLGQPARNITAHEYADVFDTLVKEGKRIFKGNFISKFIVQQDNDPTHAGVSAKKIATSNAVDPAFHVSGMAWPPHSPDLSPIENVWGIVQRQVDALGCKNFKEFEQAVIKHLQNFSRDTLVKMYNGMQGRMKLVIKANGGRIKY